MTKKVGLIVLLTALSGAASAAESCKVDHFLWFSFEVCSFHGGGSSTLAAPELDPGSALASLALAMGGLAVLRGRRLKKPQDQAA
jgi:hypothetical protein